MSGRHPAQSGSEQRAGVGVAAGAMFTEIIWQTVFEDRLLLGDDPLVLAPWTRGFNQMISLRPAWIFSLAETSP